MEFSLIIYKDALNKQRLDYVIWMPNNTFKFMKVGLQGISIFSNIEVSFFKGICNIAFLVNTVILYIAILSANLAIFLVKSLVNKSTYVLMPRWRLVPKFLNIILSNPWPLKINSSNTMLATFLLVYCLE